MQRLILFAKRPRLGRVKTRLVPALLPEQALELYQAFLDDQLRFVASFTESCDVEVCVDEPGGIDARGIRVTEQGDGDLGRRLLRAFRRSHDDGAEATVVIGVDSPTLPAESVSLAFQQLSRAAAAVLAPADDGGYVLLGLRDPSPQLFDGVPWGGPRVAELTRERAKRAGVNLVELPGWYDIDDRSGLLRLARELRSASARRRAPTTARVLEGLDVGEAGVV